MTNNKLIATPTRTLDIMKRHDIKMKKSLGQNFIIEPNILYKMIEVGELDQNTTVIEIGPGIGALTEVLAQHTRKVLAFEIDRRFVKILGETLADYDNVEVIHQDILQVDFQAAEYEWLAAEERLVVVANLPYYITTPIIMHLLGSGLPFESLIMMMQKEVAERMTAEVGTKAYNSLTIAIQNEMEAQIAFIVPRQVFIPQPNVDSSILKLKRRTEPLVKVDNTVAFESFVQKAFIHRRKTLWNNLKSAYVNEAFSQDQLRAIFEETQIEPGRRGEALTIQEFARMYHASTVFQSKN